MPYALVIAGLLLTVAGARGTQGDLYALLKGDFTGNKSFIWWATSILIIGSLGYLPKMRGVANSFLVLVFLVLILANKGVFENFVGALKGNADAPFKPANDTAGEPSDLDKATGALKTALDIGGKVAAFA
jgi:hypothetical protein